MEKDENKLQKNDNNFQLYESTNMQIEKIISEAHNDSASNDFEYARSSIYEIVEQGKNAIFELAEISKQSQHPRSYECLAKLIDSTVSASKELLTLQTKIREISASDAPISSKAQTINNNLFVGSTQQLAEALKQLNKDE